MSHALVLGSLSADFIKAFWLAELTDRLIHRLILVCADVYTRLQGAGVRYGEWLVSAHEYTSSHRPDYHLSVTELS